MLHKALSDFRYYLELMARDGRFRVVERQVDPKWELAAVISRSQKECDAPILFEDVKGSNLPVVANVYGSLSRLSALLGADEGASTLNQRWKDLLSGWRKGPRDYVNLVPPPADLIDMTLHELPRITYREKDAAPYLTSAVFLANDPETGVPNLSFSRCMMLETEEKMHCCIDAPHDLAKYQAKAEAKGERLEVAVMIGAPPAVFLAAVSSLPIDEDEMHLAAYLAGGHLDLYPCETIDLAVPVSTEFVIEGSIRPGQRTEDGPFGEFLGYYCDVNPGAYILDVHKVRRREGAHFHALLCGSREDLSLLSMSFGGRLYSELTERLPGVLEVVIKPTIHASIVRIDKQTEDHPQQVIDAVFRINPLFNRMCIVVDKDVDPHDLERVWWAFLTRGAIASRIQVLSELSGVNDLPELEHIPPGYVGIDATAPLFTKLKPATTPGESSVDLGRYIKSKAAIISQQAC